MTELQVLEMVQEVLLQSLEPPQEVRSRDVWTTCRLKEDMGATEWADYLDLALSFNQRLGLDLDLSAFARKIQAQKTVADLVSLIHNKPRFAIPA